MDNAEIVKTQIVKHQNRNLISMRKSFKKDLGYINRDIENYESQLKDKREQLSIKTAFLYKKHKRYKPNDVETMLNDIRKMREIKNITFTTSEGLLDKKYDIFITTKPIKMRDGNVENDIGEYVININLLTSNKRYYERVYLRNVFLSNLAKRYKVDIIQHPHINSSNHACFGNIENQFSYHLEKLELDKVVIVLVEFLKSYCSDNHPLMLYNNFMNSYNFLKRKSRFVISQNFINCFHNDYFSQLRTNEEMESKLNEMLGIK